MRLTPRKQLPLLVFLSTLLAVQLACFAGASGGAPAPDASVQPTFAPSATSSAEDVPAQPAVPETRMLTLEFPPTIRAGDADVVRLTLELDDQGNLVPTAQIDGNTVQGEVITIPNVYDTHTVMAEAKFEIAGFEVRPDAVISESLLPGQKVTFYWSIRPFEVGKYRGTVWFALRFIPRNGDPEETRTLSSQLVEIEAVDLFGLKSGPARWLGLAGSVIGSVLGFPFLEEILKLAWKRLRRA